jgi:uncharacterized membrane protein
MYVVSKVVLDIIPPFALITTRLLLGGLTLYAVLLRRGGTQVSSRDFARVFAVGILGYGISLGLQFIGTKMSTAANGALVTSATPAFVLIFAFFLLGERFSSPLLACRIQRRRGRGHRSRNAVLTPRCLGQPGLLGGAYMGAVLGLIRLVTRDPPSLS